MTFELVGEPVDKKTLPEAVNSWIKVVISLINLALLVGAVYIGYRMVVGLNREAESTDKCEISCHQFKSKTIGEFCYCATEKGWDRK